MWNTIPDGEAKAVGLIRAMIRILPNDDHLGLVERAMIKGRKNILSRGITSGRNIFLLYKLYQFLKIGFVKFALELGLPRRFDLNVHAVVFPIKIHFAKYFFE